MKHNFQKPPLTISQQIALLESKGLKIDDYKTARHYLHHIGYYRLSGYLNFFKDSSNGLKQNTTFGEVLNHYIFDRKIRMLFFDAIERIEVSLKSILTTVMTEDYGAFWFTNKNLFVNNLYKNFDAFEFVIQAIRKTTVDEKNKDVFIKHYYEKYASPELPPSWMTMETLSLGTTSRIFSLLKTEERKKIAKHFNIKEKLLVSWIRALTYTRNLCAHHARIWNRIFTIKVMADKRFAVCRDVNFSSGKLYAQAIVIAILFKSISPENHWERHLKDLVSDFKYSNHMGFLQHWNGFNLEQ